VKPITFENQVIIITGAAMGIGEACAKLFSETGGKLVLVDIDRVALDHCQKQLGISDDRLELVNGDTSDPGVAETAVSIAQRKWGQVDALINNAGINFREQALAVTEEHWQRIIDVNLKGYFLFAKEVGKVMTSNRKGSIVNISSELSVVGSKSGQLVYSTTKGGINQMTRTLAAEWAESGVRVNAVAPGLTETPLVAERLEDSDYREKCIEQVPLKRLGMPRDIAYAAAFLCSHWADFITGQILIVDGGYTAVR